VLKHLYRGAEGFSLGYQLESVRFSALLVHKKKKKITGDIYICIA
jgi:hypothetical protein